MHVILLSIIGFHRNYESYTAVRKICKSTKAIFFFYYTLIFMRTISFYKFASDLVPIWFQNITPR